MMGWKLHVDVSLMRGRLIVGFMFVVQEERGVQLYTLCLSLRCLGEQLANEIELPALRLADPWSPC